MTGPVLIVTIDWLPAWMLPGYGATWVAMPELSRLAARGVTFDGLVATTDEARRPAGDLVAGLGEATGLRRAVVTDDPAAEAFGDMTSVAVAASSRQAADASATGLARLFAAAAEVVSRRRHDVVWCHVTSLGRTWDAPEEFRAAYLDPDDPPPPSGATVPDVLVQQGTDPDLVTGLRHVFAGQLTLLDRCLAALVQAVGEDAAIAIAGLRGMPLGLHGRIGPGVSPPFSDLVRVPAVLVDRLGRMAGQRYDGLTTHADLGATLTEWATGASPTAGSPWAGRSRAGLFASWAGAGRDRVVVAGAGGVAVTTPTWHLVREPGEESRLRLFAKPDDFFDLCDVADRCPGVIDDLAPLAAAAAAGDMLDAWTGPLGAGGRPAD